MNETKLNEKNKMNETKLNEKNKVNIVPDDFIRVNNDINGNPRFAIHFLRFIPKQFNNDMDISNLYEYVLNLRKKLKLGGRKFHNKQYGGGLVFQSYNIKSTCNYLNEKLNKFFEEVRE